MREHLAVLQAQLDEERNKRQELEIHVSLQRASEAIQEGFEKELAS